MSNGEPPAEGDLGTDTTDAIQRDFWLGHLRIGFAIFLGETLFVLAYLGFTPHGPHRTILWIVVSAWGAGAVLNLLLAPRLAVWDRRLQWSTTCNVLASLAVAGVASLDGGLHSPLVLLLFLPAASAGLAITPWGAALCGVATLVAAGLVWAFNANPGTSVEGDLMLFVVLTGSMVLAVAAAVSRVARERNERLLLEKIAELATTDGLTGCVVHRVFYERFTEEIARARRHGDALSLILIDVDSFKLVNDTYGHLVGDHVLAAIGSALRAQTRSFDLVGRLGGDEFAVLMPETEPSAALALAERIRAAVASATEVPVTLSMGVSNLDATAPTTERMLDDADFALYQVKGDGRDGVAVRVTAPPVAPQPAEPAATV